MKLGWNPSPLALQATALSITPWLPGTWDEDKFEGKVSVSSWSTVARFIARKGLKLFFVWLKWFLTNILFRIFQFEFNKWFGLLWLHPLWVSSKNYLNIESCTSIEESGMFKHWFQFHRFTSIILVDCRSRIGCNFKILKKMNFSS